MKCPICLSEFKPVAQKKYCSARCRKIQHGRNYRNRTEKSKLLAGHHRRSTTSWGSWIRRCIRTRKSYGIRTGKIFDIDDSYLLGLLEKQQYRCAITGIMMTKNVHDPLSVSLDRINNDLGYTHGNVQLVCNWINLGKNTFRQEDIKKCISEIRRDVILKLRSRGFLREGV